MWNLFKPDSWRSRAWATELLAPLTCRKEIERRSIAIEREGLQSQDYMEQDMVYHFAEGLIIFAEPSARHGIWK